MEENFLESGCIEITENLLSQEHSSRGFSSGKKKKKQLCPEPPEKQRQVQSVEAKTLV